MELNPLLKKKKKLSDLNSPKEKEESKEELKSEQKVALHALQKQLQILKLKEWLLLFGFIGGAALLRVPMQAVPSAEPLTFFAILAGWLFGRKKGFLTGASALVLSNFFMFGGQGPWTPFQMLGFGIAGWLGGTLRKKASYVEVIIIAVLATLAFEVVMNLTTLFIFSTSIFMAFALALPFIATHLVSNVIFALALPSAKKFIEKKGGFNEKNICVNTLNKYGITDKLNWLKRFGKKEQLPR
jgi:energy-coupling factor transport system substrate-specific component